MRVLHERAQVADPEVRAAGVELVGERQRGEGREAARAAAADGEPLAVDEALLGEVLRAGDAVVDVDDPPLELEALAVVLAVAGGAAVVDVEHRVAAAGEQLEARREPGEGGRGRAAVARHDERRELAGGTDERAVGRRVEVAEGRPAAGRRELDVLRDRDVLALRDGRAWPGAGR